MTDTKKSQRVTDPNDPEYCLGIEDATPSVPGDPLNAPTEAILEQNKFIEANPSAVDAFNKILKKGRNRV